MKIGCHISIAGGIQNAPERASDLGCEVMQIFTRSPQGGRSAKIGKNVANEFKENCRKYRIADTYVHAPYYINLASANNRIRYGSVSAIKEELERASIIGAKYVMTHLGSSKELGKKTGLKKVIEMLKKVLINYNGSAKLLLENSAGAGSIIGGNLKELSEVIKAVDSSAIAGICLDTQHSFASGYDWTDFKNTLLRVKEEIGIGNVKLIHANDSLTECGSNKDRHAHIGEGLIGLNAFEKIVALAQKENVDMILETRHDKVEKDIELLKEMREKAKGGKK
ncbi:MAG TPA: deoxyribonuclease IV [Candidatus Moranbacteria bacterium]|nr:deoxyribonuclease IV [Candidatus Moranbacteria bacterium]